MPAEMTNPFLAASACDREPIHIPGAIQPHGALLAADPSRGMEVVAASLNASEVLGAPGRKPPLDKPLRDLLGPGYDDALRRCLAEGELGGAAPWETTLKLNNGASLEVATHCHAGLVIVELEPAHSGDEADALAAARELQRWTARLRAEEDAPEALGATAVCAARALTRHDRALIYRFDADWNGETIAEDKVTDWGQPFLGLHFPASDIPAQARALYARTPMRWMPMRDYEPVPLLIAAARGGPSDIDLSFARLRSMSPVHRAYHRNMGVDGAMSVSLMSKGRLWGLLVLHHRGALRVSPGRRSAVMALADAFALRLAPAERAEAERARRRDAGVQMQLLTRMAEVEDIAALASGESTIADLFRASGAAVVLGEEVRVLGAAPPVYEVVKLAEWLRKRPEPDLFHTDALPSVCPVLRHRAAEVSGLLAIFIEADRRDMLLWFRPEEPRTLAWGGDPRKPVDTGPDGPGPRASFERWIEERRGVARPWTEWECELACGLRHAITEVLLHHLRRVSALGEQLRQAQKMEALGQLVGGVAHDFNNLLTVIIGSLVRLDRELPEGGRGRRLAAAAQHAAERAAGLTHRLLAFARRQALEPRLVDVNGLIEGMVDLLRRTLGAGIALETALAADLGRTRADPNQVESALLNLAVNARDAMSGGGRLTIETMNTRIDAAYPMGPDGPEPGVYVVIAVSDTGTGMDRETLARVFEPFFTTKEPGRGTGLGLSQVHGFVRQSGGHVTIYSELGQGTTVRLYLPRLSDIAHADEGHEMEATPVAGRGETVLVVEDDQAVQTYAEEVLTDAGYCVVGATGGPEALAALRREPTVRLLFTDIGLPGGMDGQRLAAEAAVLRPGIAVLFTTGYAPSAALREGKLDPDVPILIKPYTPEALTTRVRRVLDDT
jgi:light-regulated signal transduction histidine kinase (bacteriophytochrome)/CheY-like chemotaxis protein